MKNGGFKQSMGWVAFCLMGLLVGLGVMLPSQAVEWHAVSDDLEGNLYFMDRHSIRQEGPLVTYAWTTTPEMAKKIARGTGCPVARQVRRVVVFNTSDCQGQKIYKAVQTRFYNKNNEVIWKEVYDRVQRSAQSPKPNSVFERMHQAACGVPGASVSHLQD